MAGKQLSEGRRWGGGNLSGSRSQAVAELQLSGMMVKVRLILDSAFINSTGLN